jgi:hypothetical protein
MVNDKKADDTFHPDVTLPSGAIVGRRRSGNEERLSVLRPLREGVALSGEEEIVRLSRSSNGTGALDVESYGKAKGPGKFTTRAYRSNYDAVFSQKRDQNQALN